MITAKQVKDLREKTGAGMMACKKALTKTDGDVEKAIEYLREKGLADASKKAGRVAAEGTVKTLVNCETDFVADNEQFTSFADKVCKIVMDNDVNTVEELEQVKFDGDTSVKDALTALIATLGENMTIRRFKKVSVQNGAVQSYVHGGGRIGVLVKAECDKDSDVVAEVCKELCMQVAAASPLYLCEADVDQTAVDKEREIYRVQALNEGKPEKIVVRMVEGRIKKY